MFLKPSEYFFGWENLLDIPTAIPTPQVVALTWVEYIADTRHIVDAPFGTLLNVSYGEDAIG